MFSTISPVGVKVGAQPSAQDLRRARFIRDEHNWPVEENRYQREDAEFPTFKRGQTLPTDILQLAGIRRPGQGSEAPRNNSN